MLVICRKQDNNQIHLTVKSVAKFRPFLRQVIWALAQKDIHHAKRKRQIKKKLIGEGRANDAKYRLQ